MRKPTKIFLYSLIILAFGLFALSFLPNLALHTKISKKPSESAAVQPSTITISTSTNPTKTTNTPPSSPKTPSLASVNFTLSVRDTSYTSSIKAGTTLFEAMNYLASTTQFRFHATQFSGLGHLIDEINGIKAQPGTYWILYVNGVQANVGADSYTIFKGDSIVWKLEDSSKHEISY